MKIKINIDIIELLITKLLPGSFMLIRREFG